jgi:hypothetical protein
MTLRIGPPPARASTCTEQRSELIADVAAAEDYINHRIALEDDLEFTAPLALRVFVRFQGGALRDP